MSAPAEKSPFAPVSTDRGDDRVGNSGIDRRGEVAPSRMAETVYGRIPKRDYSHSSV